MLETSFMADFQHQAVTRYWVLATRYLLFGGADRDRTGDPLVANQVLSQLSYSPMVQVSGFQKLQSFNVKP